MMFRDPCRQAPRARRLLVSAGSVVAALFATAPLFALTGDEIIRRMEQHERHTSVHSTGSMEITDRFGTRTKTFISTALGDDRSLLEFTNPEEAGQKVLRLEDEIYLYFPDSEDVIHLQGAALRDSLLGSDFSYEDMTGSKSRLDDYEVALEGTEEIDGHETYRLRLTAKRRDVVYPDSGGLDRQRAVRYPPRGTVLGPRPGAETAGGYRLPRGRRQGDRGPPGNVGLHEEGFADGVRGRHHHRR